MTDPQTPATEAERRYEAALDELLDAIDNAGVMVLLEGDGGPEPDWQTRLFDAADAFKDVRGTVTP